MGVLCLTGCLIPPPLEPEPEPENHPPRLVPENLVPAPTFLPLTLVEECPEQQQFEASIEDPDGDVLFYRVFVDYASADSERQPPVNQTDTEPQEPVSITFDLTTDRFVGPNPHVVELLVADREFREDLVPPEGRVLFDPQGLVDTFVWSVVLDPTGNPQCPD